MQTEGNTPKIVLDDILHILYQQCEEINQATVLTSTVVQSAIAFVRHDPDRFPEPQLRTIPAAVIKLLLQAEDAGEVILTREGSAILRVFFSGYYIRRIKKRLHEIRKEPELPLPTASSLGLDPPEQIITVVKAQENLISFLERTQEETLDDEHDIRLIRLTFLPDVAPMLLPYSFLSRDLALICLQKIRFYLRNERNQSYMRQKMLGLFRHREKLVEDTFTAILSRPENILSDIWQPNEFSYYFWIQITATIAKEFADKKEKSVNEQNYTQAAALMGMLLAHRKSLMQRESDRQTAVKQLENHLKSDPFLFTLNNIFEFTDKNGVPLTKKIGHQEIIEFVEKEEIPNAGDKIPPLVRLNLSDGSRQYIRKDLFLVAFFQHARDVREKLMKSFVAEWSDALELGIKLFEMQNQDAFEEAIQDKLQQLDPSLNAMLEFSTLYYISREVPLNEQVKSELRKILDTKKLQLKPLSEFFALDQQRLFSDAKLLLPAWKVVFILSHIVRFLQKMFIGIDRDEEAMRIRLKEHNRAAAQRFSRKSQTEQPSPPGNSQKRKPSPSAVHQRASSNSQQSEKRYKESLKKTVAELQQQLSAGYNSSEEACHAALERWNTIIDRKHRRNLTIDVESLAKDQARKILQKRGSPPTAERIDELSLNLASKDVFENIRDKKSLKQFIELTIVKHLSTGR